MNQLETPGKESSHDPGDIAAAFTLAREPQRMHVGVLYRREPAVENSLPPETFVPARLAAIAENYR
jgi:hypothetical protein